MIGSYFHTMLSSAFALVALLDLPLSVTVELDPLDGVPGGDLEQDTRVKVNV